MQFGFVAAQTLPGAPLSVTRQDRSRQLRRPCGRLSQWNRPPQRRQRATPVPPVLVASSSCLSVPGDRTPRHRQHAARWSAGISSRASSPCEHHLRQGSVGKPPWLSVGGATCSADPAPGGLRLAARGPGAGKSGPQPVVLWPGEVLLEAGPGEAACTGRAPGPLAGTGRSAYTGIGSPGPQGQSSRGLAGSGLCGGG